MTAPMLNRQELGMVKEFVLLPIVLDVIQQDLKLIHTLRLKLRLSALMVKELSDIQDRIARELSELNRQLRENGIKVYEQRRTSVRLEVRYRCRGYDHELNMLWSLVRAEVMVRMSGYMNVSLKDGK